jgi:predicted RNA-binding protein with TRAM domain
MGEEKKFGIPKPVAVGDTVDVLIEGQGGQGDGIAKVEGFVVFVKGAQRGERCAVKITDVKRTFATGEKSGPARPAKESAEEMEAETEGAHDGPSG